MKQFRFSLETVLDYKQQVLDSLQIEYGSILSMVRVQEEALARAEARYAETNEEFREKKRSGLTIAGARSYDVGLQVLEQIIRRESEKLLALRQQEEAAHTRLVESKIDTSSLELLREKKLSLYQKETLKQDERLIDDLFSFARISTSSLAP